jgi:hypothetical protein
LKLGSVAVLNEALLAALEDPGWKIRALCGSADALGQ